MIREKAKLLKTSGRFDAILKKYHIPAEALAINRRAVSKAVGVGLFVALIPMPFQMLAVVLLFPLFRYNVLIAIAMCWLSNPVTMPFMYYIEYLTGNWLLGGDPLPDVQMSVDWFQAHLGDIFLPLYVGTLFYAVILSPLAFLLVNRLWIRSVRKAHHRRSKKRKKR